MVRYNHRKYTFFFILFELFFIHQMIRFKQKEVQPKTPQTSC